MAFILKIQAYCNAKYKNVPYIKNFTERFNNIIIKRKDSKKSLLLLEYSETINEKEYNDYIKEYIKNNDNYYISKEVKINGYKNNIININDQSNLNKIKINNNYIYSICDYTYNNNEIIFFVCCGSNLYIINYYISKNNYKKKKE